MNMADVRCPMCSKINPADAEVCSHCGARLKPVQSQPHPFENNEAEPDWLSSLRGQAPSGTNAPQNLSSDQEESPGQSSSEPQSDGLPDWLTRIRERARNEPTTESPLSGPEEEAQDWMNNLREKEEGFVNNPNISANLSEPENAADEWLTRLPGSQQADEQPEELPGIPGGEPSSIDDWFQQYPKSPGAEAAEKDEDWISKLSAWQSAEDTGALENQANAAQSFTQQHSADSAPSSDSFGMTDFLASLNENQQADQPPANQPQDEPDFSSAGSAESNIPDWLRGEEDLTSLTATPLTGPVDSALPAWMESGEFETTGESGPAAETGASPSALPANEPHESSEPENLPEWFSAFDDEQESTTEPPVSSQGEDYAAAADSLPEWLQEGSASQAAESASSEQDIPPAKLGWLNDFSKSMDMLVEEAISSNSALPDGEPFGVAFEEEPEEAKIPADIESPVSSKKLETTVPEPVSDEETPQWLKEFSAQGAAEPDTAHPLAESDEQAIPFPVDEVDQILAGGELPDWLSEERPENETNAKPQQAGEPASEGIAQAELPEWVKEMRPIESVLPNVAATPEANQQVEKMGPLAGLRGVIPAGDAAAGYRKLPVYSAKLRVTEKQRSQASLFESILSQETQPILIAPRRSKAPRLFARIVVAVLFLTVLFGLRFFPLGLSPAPLLTPPELLDMFEQIDRIDHSQAPTLLAVDFEPGRAGEMLFTASPVIEHLMAKNTRIVVLSTVPAGPALAQRLLEDTAIEMRKHSQQTYDLGSQTLNLGYLPGGTISLLEFAQIPSRAAPANLTGDYGVWHNSFLKEVTGMNGFSQVIVLTDSAETGRAWVEQVQPLMGETPLFMITSAQAAPMLMPYVQSKQVNGLVSGLLGGLIYGQWRQAETAASTYWELYQAGTLLAFSLTLIGAVVSGSKALLRRKNRDEA